jgi:hypothetical protein
MNPCRRCGGLMVSDFDQLWFVKCLICGHRLMEPHTEPSPPKLDESYCRCGEKRMGKMPHCRGCHRRLVLLGLARSLA